MFVNTEEFGWIYERGQAQFFTATVCRVLPTSQLTSLVYKNSNC